MISFARTDNKVRAKPTIGIKKLRIFLLLKNSLYLCGTMKSGLPTIQFIGYDIIFFGVWGGLAAFRPLGGYIWDPWIINFSTSVLFTLLVCLSARLARTDQTIIGILTTATFIIFFCPGEEVFFERDLNSLTELSSQCIVPFFIGQYTRVSQKEFHKWYFLMLLMGIFCSYTHNGITIPLCCTFVWLAFQRRERFFRQACWPMVIGVIIGTGLSIWQRRNDSLNFATDLTVLTSVTSIALKTLWETKVFVLSLGITAYLISRKEGRKTLKYIVRRHYVLALCCIFSLFTMPFAPLGIENAVTGVCFFSMFWLLFLCQYLVEKYLNRKI